MNHAGVGGGGQSLMCTHATGVGCRDRIPHGLQPLFVGRSDGSSLPIFVLMEKEDLNWSVFPAGTWKCFELLVADLSYRQLLLEWYIASHTVPSTLLVPVVPPHARLHLCNDSLSTTLQASLSGTFLQTLPDLVLPLKGHSLSPRSCPPLQSAPCEKFGYWYDCGSSLAPKHACKHEMHPPRVKKKVLSRFKQFWF